MTDPDAARGGATGPSAADLGATDPGAKDPGGPFASLSLEHSSTVDRVAEELHRALFDGDIEPGTPLRELALADAMGVSRSTIREALGVLVAEGLATRAPNRGVFVTALDPEGVRDVARARAVVEVAGARRWPDASQEARDAVRQALDAFDAVAATEFTPSELTAAHLAIHRAFAGLTESTRLIALADALYAEIRLGLAKVDRIRRNADEQAHAHRELLTLLERGDTEGAARALQEHLEHAEESMLAALHLPPVDEN